MPKYQQVIYDTAEETYLQNDVNIPETEPEWGDGLTAFIFTSEEDLSSAIAVLGDTLGRFIGQNPPPR